MPCVAVRPTGHACISPVVRMPGAVRPYWACVAVRPTWHACISPVGQMHCAVRPSGARAAVRPTGHAYTLSHRPVLGHDCTRFVVQVPCVGRSSAGAGAVWEGEATTNGVALSVVRGHMAMPGARVCVFRRPAFPPYMVGEGVGQETQYVSYVCSLAYACSVQEPSQEIRKRGPPVWASARIST